MKNKPSMLAAKNPEYAVTLDSADAMLKYNLGLLVATTTLQVSSITSLSFCHSATSTHPKASDGHARKLEVLTTICGATTGSLTLCLPYLIFTEDPLVECVLRIVCFFYGCKILDLAVARARSPPVLLNAGQPVAPTTTMQRLDYIWLLLTETRYSAFDIAVHQKERVEELSNAWTLAPPIVVPLMVYLVPSPETKSMAALFIIQIGLESLHAAFHPSCPNYLFWKPFAASSLTSFWRTHWHAGAETFLRSLGYVPGRDIALMLGSSSRIARAVGVISAFNVSGIWHGWATAALATRPWMVGFRVWALFVGMGIGVVAEAAMPKTWRGCLLHRILVWVLVMFWAGWAWRGLQSNCKVQWLADL